MLNQFIAFLTPKIDPAMRDYEGTYFCCNMTWVHLPQTYKSHQEGYLISHRIRDLLLFSHVKANTLLFNDFALLLIRFPIQFDTDNM